MSSLDWIRRGGLAAAVGGLLWALLPLGMVSVSIEETQPGTPAHMAVAAVYWLMAVAPLLLLLAGLAALHALHKGAYGRPGNAGFFVLLAALVAMFAGNGVEVASLTFAGTESDVGHTLFLIGFLILLVGSVLLGIALVRTRRDRTSRLAGLLLTLALPLGILFAFVLGTVAPETDLGFWATITVPYGTACMLLGTTLASRRAEHTGQPARVT